MLKTYELFIDENDFKDGIHAISLVSDPAIESDWVTLSKNKKEIKLQAINDEKRLLMGAALIPEKLIYRKNETTGEEFNIVFSKETVRKASELFFKQGFQSESTLEHEISLRDNTVVESWIVEDIDKDKTALYGLDAPVGSWVVSMKIENDQVYQMAKEGLIKGFSIEGYFSDKAINQSKEGNDEFLKELTDLYEMIENKTKK